MIARTSYNSAPGKSKLALSINLDGESARDWFLLIADAIADKAWQLSGGTEDDRGDAKLLNELADKITASVLRQRDKEDETIDLFDE